MIARRVLFLAVLLTMGCVAAWGQNAPFSITPTSLPIGGGVLVVGQAIPTQQLAPNPNLDASFTWSKSSGSLPPGLTFNTSLATITGTPTVPGAFTFTITAVESGNIVYTASQQYTLYVSTGSPLTLTPRTPLGGAVGSNYATFPFDVAGGVPGYTWALQSGTSVNGLTLASDTGLLSGIPLAGGVFPVSVIITDASGAQAKSSFNLNVLGISTSSLPDGTTGVPYAQTLTSVGTTGSVIWSLGSIGTLPSGLNLSAQGQIAGTPTVSGTFPFQVRVTDPAANLTATQSFSISITANSILTVTTTSPLPNGAVGVAYSQTLQATGGIAPYTWSATGLPAGLQVDSTTGILSGTPTVGATPTISVTVTDAVGTKATASLSLTVGAFTITPATLPNGFVNVPYAAALTVAGSTIASWTVTTGTLPAGLTLDASTGVISGKPTTAGSSTFTITASFGNLTAAFPPVVQGFTLVINAGPSVVISGLPPTGVAATQPAATVSLSGGTYPLGITGTMTLTFAPTGGGTPPFDAKFASGPPTTATFTIPAGTSQGLFGAASAPSVPVMIGTVAGTITITTSLQDSNGNSVPPPAPVVISVNATVPVITKVTIGAIANGAFTISVTGRSTPRDMTSALFHFALPTNTQPSTLDVTVPLTSDFAAWYGSSASSAFGSTFTVTVKFSFTGPPGSTVPFTAVTVTMTNSVGASTPFGPVNP